MLFFHNADSGRSEKASTAIVGSSQRAKRPSGYKGSDDSEVAFSSTSRRQVSYYLEQIKVRVRQMIGEEVPSAECDLSVKEVKRPKVR